MGAQHRLGRLVGPSELKKHPISGLEQIRQGGRLLDEAARHAGSEGLNARD